MKIFIWVMAIVLAVAIGCGKKNDKDNYYGQNYNYDDQYYNNDPYYNRWGPNQQPYPGGQSSGGFIWCPDDGGMWDSGFFFDGCMNWGGAPAVSWNGNLNHPWSFYDMTMQQYPGGNFNDWFCNSQFSSAGFYQGNSRDFGNFCGSGGLFQGGYNSHYGYPWQNNYGYAGGGVYFGW